MISKVIAEELIHKLKREIENAENIVLVTHVGPDGDALGSMIALYLFLQRRGIQVQMWLDDNLPVMYSFLPHLDKIARPPVTPQPVDLFVVLVGR